MDDDYDDGSDPACSACWDRGCTKCDPEFCEICEHIIERGQEVTYSVNDVMLAHRDCLDKEAPP